MYTLTDAPTDQTCSAWITETAQSCLLWFVSCPYQAADVHAGLQQRLDGAVVSVPCSQVKRGVPATVAAHEVGVGVHQHAHHLQREGACDGAVVLPEGLFSPTGTPPTHPPRVYTR